MPGVAGGSDCASGCKDHHEPSALAVSWRTTPSGQAAPPSLFHYLVTGQSFGRPGIAPLNGMQVVMSTRTTVDWGWNPALHLWMRGMNGTAYVNPGGAQLGVPNVIL